MCRRGIVVGGGGGVAGAASSDTTVRQGRRWSDSRVVRRTAVCSRCRHEAAICSNVVPGGPQSADHSGRSVVENTLNKMTSRCSRPNMVAENCYEHVSLSVCLYVCLSASISPLGLTYYMSNRCQSPCIGPWLGVALAVLRYTIPFPICQF